MPNVDSTTVPRAFAPLPLPPLPAEPLVTVLMATHNYAAYLPEAIESVICQRYARFELIVCDDGSTDDTAAVVERYAAADPRVRRLPLPHAGQAAAKQAGYAESRGEIVCMLDADDWCYPDRLERVVEAFRRAPDAGVCVHAMQPVSRTGERIAAPLPDRFEEGWVAPALLQTGLFGVWLSTSGLNFRRAVLNRVFPLPADFLTTYSRTGSPIDLYAMSIGRFLTPVVSIPAPLVGYRFHDANDGSQSRATPATLGKPIAHFEHVYGLVRDFIAREYGRDVVRGVSLLDYPVYVEHLLALYLVDGKPRTGERGYPPSALLARLPADRRRRLWRVLLALPAPLAGRALDAWWGMAPWKRWVRPLWRRLLRQPAPLG